MTNASGYMLTIAGVPRHRGDNDVNPLEVIQRDKLTCRRLGKVKFIGVRGKWDEG